MTTGQIRDRAVVLSFAGLIGLLAFGLILSRDHARPHDALTAFVQQDAE